MTENERLERLLKYDRWASLKISRVLSITGNFKKMEESLGLLAHLVASQRLWYLRVTGEDTGERQFWPQENLDDIHDEIEEMHTTWIDFLHSELWDPEKTVSYKNSKGEPYETPLGDILHHLVIHGQHHRAQISQLLRQSEITPPATDFIYFTRDNNSEK